jgi:branched-chain amino acid transport system permease protein
MFSIAHAAFFGIGAYTSAILLTQFQAPFIIALITGAVVAGFGGLIIGIPTLRLKGDYLLIATLGFGEIIQSLLKNWSALTGGSSGISRIPAPDLFGFTLDSELKYLLFLLLFLAVTVGLCWCIKTSPFGTILKGIAEDEIIISSIGRNPYKYKITAFVFSATVAGFCGVFYASYMTYISPGNFVLAESILIFTMMVFGGLGSIPGSILGATVLVVLPELLRFLGLPTETAANLRQMLYGVLLILMMRFRPKGLLGEFKV